MPRTGAGLPASRSHPPSFSVDIAPFGAKKPSGTGKYLNVAYTPVAVWPGPLRPGRPPLTPPAPFGGARHTRIRRWSLFSMSTDMQQPLALHACKPHPIAGLRGKDLLNSSRQVLTQTLRQPVHSARHLLRFGSTLKDVLLDKANLRPEPSDRRFSDPAW